MSLISPNSFKTNFGSTDHMPGLLSMHYWIVPLTFKYTKVVR